MADLCTAFELNDQDCKIVALRTHKQQMSVVAAASVSFVEDGTGEVVNARRKSQIIREALKQKKIQVQKATLVMPKHLVQARCVTLPSDNEQELERMARFEAAKIIPFNVENYIISHSILKKDSIQGSKVIIAAVEDKNVEESIQILMQAGVDVENVTTSNIALYNMFHLVEPKNITKETYALVNIGHLSTDISIVDKGILTFSRSSLNGLDRLVGDVYPEQRSKGRPTLDYVGRISAQDIEENGTAKSPGLSDLGTSASDLPDQSGKPGGIVPSMPPLSPSPTPGLTPAGHSILDLDAESGKQPAIDTTDETDGDASSAGKRITLTFNGGAPKDEVPTEGEHTESVKPSPQADPEAISSGIIEPGNDTPLKDWLTKLIQEIRRTYEFSRREFEVPAVTRLFVLGEGALIEGLEKYLKNALGIETKVINPMRAEVIAIADKAIPNPMEEFGYALAAGGALGVLWSDACSVNLIPQKYVELRLVRNKRTGLITTAVLALLAMVLGSMAMVRYHDDNRELLNWYTEQLNNIDPIYKEIQEIKNKKDILDSFIRDRRSALGILEQISQFEYIPKQVAILEFKYIKGETVVIRAHALTIEDINRFIYDLEQMETDTTTGEKFFSAVTERQRRPTKLPRRNEQIYVFNLECDIIQKRGNK